MNEIKELWGIILAVVGGIFWLARLEGRVNSNSKEIMRLERLIQDDRAEARVYTRAMSDADLLATWQAMSGN